MKTISEAEFASYLVRAKQKLDVPDVAVDPLSQVVVAEGKGVKRGRRTEAATTSNKTPRLEEDTEGITKGGADETEAQTSLPLVTIGRTLWSHAAAAVTYVAPSGETVDSAAAEDEGSKQDSPPTWGEDFDPVAFVAENLKGHSSRLDTINPMVFARQEKEAAEKLEREVGVVKEGSERTHAEVLAKKQAKFDKTLAREKMRLSVLKKEKRNLVLARNSLIVALVKIWKDAAKRDADMASLQEAADRLAGDLKELEEEVDVLKEAMADHYVGGFRAAIE
jgi:hypothetical protein